MTGVREITQPEGIYHERRSRASADAQRKQLLEYVATLPDAREYAMTLPYHVVEALLSARYSKRDNCWWVDRQTARLLIPYGFCEVGKNLNRHAIGAFGRQVMREFKKDGG